MDASWTGGMLAERKDKKKWSVDPNGTNWSKDSNKFGTKMLEKMGWTQGKGLGAREDGCTEHVKVKKKNDQRGVGCSMKEANNWVAHQDDFSSILAQLNDHHTDAAEKGETNGVSNLEKHSKSQKRVHYHKYAKGKNLSNYKDDDLSAIFGKRATKSAPVTPLNLSEEESSGAESSSSLSGKKKKKTRKQNDSTDESQNHVTSTMSVQEYFAKRMSALKNKGPCDSTQNVGEDSNPANTKLDPCEATVEKTVKVNKAKKRKKKKGEDCHEKINGTSEENIEQTVRDGLSSSKEKNIKTLPKKKKSKKRKRAGDSVPDDLSHKNFKESRTE